MFPGCSSLGCISPRGSEGGAAACPWKQTTASRPQILMMLPVDSYPILQGSWLHCQDHLLQQQCFGSAVIVLQTQLGVQGTAPWCAGSQAVADTLFVKVWRLLPRLADQGSGQLLSSSASHFFQCSPFVLTSPTSVLIHLWHAVGKTTPSLPNLWCS